MCINYALLGFFYLCHFGRHNSVWPEVISEIKKKYCLIYNNANPFT